MFYALLADGVLIGHFLFIVWVALGALAVNWRPALVFAHLPAIGWGVYVELSGRLCPLTPLEQQLRRAAGEQGYAGGFIDHYLVALIYPDGLTRSAQIAIGLGVLGLNIVAYTALLYRRRRKDR